MKTIRFAPSMMCADSLHYADSLRALETAGADFLHMDVMDGHFVDNFCLHFDAIRAMAAASSIPAEIHMMVTEPAKWIAAAKSTGARYLSFHWEATHDAAALLAEIRAAGMLPGLVLNPETDAEVLLRLPEMPAYVTCMSVQPGFAGQKFIPSVYEKITRVRQLLDDKKPDAFVMVDGCMNTETAPLCVRAGADVLVCGTSAFFGKPAPLTESAAAFFRFVRENAD